MWKRWPRRQGSEAMALAEALAFPTTGNRVGAYRLGSLLGKGGTGEVYRATREDEAFSKAVAVKLLYPAGPSAATSFQGRESALLARLEHPHIARLYDAGVLPTGIRYLILEHIDGHTVVEHCQREALSVPDRLRLFLKICDR